jgi:hypothetical protein
MGETRRKFDKDFREGAVRLVRETGKPIAWVARIWISTLGPPVTGWTLTGAAAVRATACWARMSGRS